MKRAKIIKHKDGSKSLVIKLGDVAEITRFASLFNYTPVTDYLNNVQGYEWWKTGCDYDSSFTTSVCNALTSIGANSNFTDDVSVAIRNHPASKCR